MQANSPDKMFGITEKFIYLPRNLTQEKMKKVFQLFVVAFFTLCATTSYAQSAADRLLGIYEANEEGRISKVRFTRLSDGTYQGQIIWLNEPNHPDGSPKLDVKNPDESKRSVRCDQVVIVWGLKYDAKNDRWSGGKVYRPTDGKTFSCRVEFEEDGTTLRVRGSFGPISVSRYWTKLE